MAANAEYQESLFRAIEVSAEQTRKLGHPPLLGDLALDVLEPLLPPIHVATGRPGLKRNQRQSCRSSAMERAGPTPLLLHHDVTDAAARAVVADLLFRPMQARAEVASDGRWVLDDDGTLTSVTSMSSVTSVGFAEYSRICP
jgi:hypothetical protein